MATNEILTTASVDNGTNLQTQSEYSADAQRPTGQSSGVARSKFINKTLRQLSVVAAGVAQFIADRQDTNVVDSLVPATFATMLSTALFNQERAIASGTADAILLSLTPAATAFSGNVISWKATATNATTTPTVKRDGLAAKTLVKGNGVPLVAGDVSGMMLSYYDATLDCEVLLNPVNGLATLIPVGTSIAVNGNVAPTGFLKENGAAYSRTAYPQLFSHLVKSSTVTLSIAAPGVVTWNGHGRSANDPIKFASTGLLPTGISAGVTYYVVSASITANTFQLSATPGGSAITTSGSQTGTHTATCAPWGDGDGSTTFNVPDSRGEFWRGWDDGRGADANRVQGSAQGEEFKAHTHNITTNVSGGGATPRGAVASLNQGADLISASAGGTETRPRNVAKLFCIKF